MSTLETLPNPLAPVTMVPVRVTIDWPALLEQRPAILKHTELQDRAYLLMPEIERLLDHCLKENQGLMIDTLWHTGARISECLALKPESFVLDVAQPYVSLETLKTRGRPKKGTKSKHRLVPIDDARFIRRMTRYIKSLPVKRGQLIFPITRSAANKRIERFVDRLPYPLPFAISPHNFRHSFAVNAILHGTPLPVLQAWLGHADIQSTIIYTKVLTLETHHFMRQIDYYPMIEIKG